jgi:hypothetical protein
MKVVSVSAPCNGSGKTSLLLSIASAFPGVFSAVKFTTIYREEQFCPVKDHDCACHRLEGKYLICADPDVLSQPNTDTGKLSETPVRKVYWCIAKPEGYPEMLTDLQEHCLHQNTPLLVEGNTVTEFLVPQLRLFMVNPWLPLSWWKQHSRALLDQSDFIVVNSYRSEPDSAAEPEAAIVAALRQVGGKQIVMEGQKRLDLWQDRRLYTAISSLLASEES